MTTTEPASQGPIVTSTQAVLPQAWRIEVLRRPERDDPQGQEALDALAEEGLSASSVRLVRGLLLSPHLERSAVEALAARFLVDPVLDRVQVIAPGEVPTPSDANHRVLIAPKPGVMDPVARTIEAMLERNGIEPRQGLLDVATFRVFEVTTSASVDACLRAATRTLANPTIEDVLVDNEALSYGVRLGRGVRGRVETSITQLDDAGLEALSVQGQLSLNLIEMQGVQAHFRELGREPSSCELETVAQTWSEHCKHKTLCGVIEFEDENGTERIDNLLKTTIAAATHALDKPWCLSVFVDNAGIVEFDQGQALAIKVETHNHPSAIDPYGGSGTGIGGVVRDILGAGLGAKPIANTNAFFVGPPDLKESELPKGSMHPKRILRGVVGGVRDYGNRMGIPTIAGGVWFDEGFVMNPLVYAGTIGLIPSSMAQKYVHPGDLIVSLGGRTGKDGIHGATFSSIELTEDSETSAASAVQIGDPITEKRVADALMQARDRGLYRGITDCGAGGYSSAVGEMGEETGAEIDLAKVPLKYAGLSSDEIWISEAQERMVLSVPPENVNELIALCESEDVEATVLGHFTDTKRLVVKDGDDVCCDLSMSFLHDGTPRPVRQATWVTPQLKDPGALALGAKGRSLSKTLKKLLSDPNLASKEWIIRQYDHEVQGTSVVKPLVGEHSDGPSDGTVIRPLASSKKGAAIGVGANPWQGALDPYAMALSSIDEALRNAVAVGADPSLISILDNFSWGNSELPEELGALVLAAKACQDAAMAYGTPFVSGKDSLNNTYRVGGKSISIPRTLLITALGIVPDVAHCVTMDLKRAGNALFLVGATKPELGASRYHATFGQTGGCVPKPDLATAPALFTRMHAAIAAGTTRSVHDLSEGGLAVAAAEMAFAGELGMDLSLEAIECECPAGYEPNATRLFSESTTRFLVEVESHAIAGFQTHLPDAVRVGTVRADQQLAVFGVDGTMIAEIAVQDLKSSFKGAFQG